MQLPADGRKRVVVETIIPEIDGGRFAVKRIVGDILRVDAVAFVDGHDTLTCEVLYKYSGEKNWSIVPMAAAGNDKWSAEFPLSTQGIYLYTVRAWADRFKTWRSDLAKRIAASQDYQLDLLIGAQLIEEASRRAGGEAEALRSWASSVRSGDTIAATSEELFAAMQRHPDRSLATQYERELTVQVDRPKARFSAWYELFPRSTAPEPGRHGTFKDCEARLPYISAMAFDVVYLPPIHPVGRQFRRGKNNSPDAQPADVGSPWAIGDVAGGHTAVHPELGSLAEFHSLLLTASTLNLEVALDIAFQCSPDHPWVTEHPEWFRKKPDGSIQYAENPPKKYLDIYPLDFETPQWRELWSALKGVFEFWIEQGVKIFRVDNPHTKPFAFWEWAIPSIKARHPEVLFLAEAFTRPHLMYRLAKLGFTQSYTYFTWRNSKEELTQYFEELGEYPVSEFFRPNLWPNTPDILHETLQSGGRPAFIARLVLAATLGAGYGIYGPAFELLENVPKQSGSEEYVNSEKYELKHRDLNSAQSLKDLIGSVNRFRRENIALQNDHTLRFHGTDNPKLICYSKVANDLSNAVLVVVNLDWVYTQSGWLNLDLSALGLEANHRFEVDDLLSGKTFSWWGSRNYVALAPVMPAHVLRIRR